MCDLCDICAEKGAAFCVCGRRLRCPACGDMPPIDARFCIECGHTLAAAETTQRLAATGATKRLDDTLYVTAAEYEALLIDRDTTIIGPYFSSEKLAFHKGRQVMVREEP